MLSVTVNAHAKVNWHLKIGSKLPNGYHTIESVFQKISLHDVIKVTLARERENVPNQNPNQNFKQEKVTGLDGYVASGKSTVDKAIELWKERTKAQYGIYVDVQKNIPAKSGLGGGSSDAASVLLALNSLDKKLSFSELLDIALSIGCDVPFFLHDCNTACVFGMGEIVMPIEERHNLQGFLILPNVEKSSTKDAFEALDKCKAIASNTNAGYEILSQGYTKPYTTWNYHNDFETIDAISNTRPQIELLDDERLFLTGSGNCWVLLSKRNTLALKKSTIIPFSTHF